MLPKKISILLNLFDIFGYNTRSSFLTAHRKASCFIQMIHIAIAIIFTAYKAKMTHVFFLELRLIEVLNQMLQYSVACYTYWLIVLDSHVHQHEHRQFWRLVQKIDKHYSKQGQFTFQSFLRKFVVFFFLTITLLVLIFTCYRHEMTEVAFVNLSWLKCVRSVYFIMFFVSSWLDFNYERSKNVSKQWIYWVWNGFGDTFIAFISFRII